MHDSCLLRILQRKRGAALAIRGREGGRPRRTMSCEIWLSRALNRTQAVQGDYSRRTLSLGGTPTRTDRISFRGAFGLEITTAQIDLQSRVGFSIC